MSGPTLTADAHLRPPAYLLRKSRMGPDLNSPSYRSAVVVSPLQTMSSAGALSTPNLAAASSSSLTCSVSFHVKAQILLASSPFATAAHS